MPKMGAEALSLYHQSSVTGARELRAMQLTVGEPPMKQLKHHMASYCYICCLIGLDKMICYDSPHIFYSTHIYGYVSSEVKKG